MQRRFGDPLAQKLGNTTYVVDWLALSHMDTIRVAQKTADSIRRSGTLY